MLASLLAHALVELGLLNEAQEQIEFARASGAGASHPHIEHLWKEAQARVFARTGRVDEAEQLAREALELVRGGHSSPGTRPTR